MESFYEFIIHIAWHLEALKNRNENNKGLSEQTMSFVMMWQYTENIS